MQQNVTQPFKYLYQSYRMSVSFVDVVADTRIHVAVLGMICDIVTVIDRQVVWS